MTDTRTYVGRTFDRVSDEAAEAVDRFLMLNTSLDVEKVVDVKDAIFEMKEPE